ncbi:MAG: uroporphyrinogen-III synthase [Bacteroidetes bacterium]|nr:uroporphyrinogen-III synthase [Bacteroidota bacterium]
MNKSLSGKRIAVTRPVHQSDEICKLLKARGAVIIKFPTVRIVATSNPQPLKEAFSRLESFDRVIFTSVNGVIHSWQYVTPPWPKSVKVAAIGPATASALRDKNVVVDVVPSEYIAEALVSSLGPVNREAILLPRASKTRAALAELLQQGGAEVTCVTAYETHLNQPSDSALAMLAHGVDIVTFTSGSTVHGYMEVTSNMNLSATVACIGPITAQVATDEGLNVDIIADTYTSEGLVTAIENYFE